MDGEWRDLTNTVTEVIKVKGQPDEVMKIGFTHRGPIISSTIVGGGAVLFGGAVPNLKKEKKFSFGWGMTQHRDDNFQMIRQLYKSNANVITLMEFADNHGPFSGVAMNLVMADVDGNIGYKMLAPVPKRKNQTPFIGARVLDGRTSDFDWDGWVPLKDLPGAVNPEKGYIVTANNRQVPDNALFDYGASQMATGRSQRIDEMIRLQIASGKKFALQDLADIQQDATDVQARDVL